MKKVFIGIDFSKLKFDAVVLFDSQSTPIHMVFNNGEQDYERFLDWCKSLTQHEPCTWLVCGEHTGLYSLGLTKYLNESAIDIWLEPGLQIKHSMGITRGKNDKVDAYHIALYACRFVDQARSTKLRAETLDRIKDLLAYRERLICAKKYLLVAAKELYAFKSNDSVNYIFEDSMTKAQEISKTIKVLENKIDSLIANQKELYENYKLLLSIKGIGRQNAVLVLVLTENFTRFNDARKFGCYAGVVPFEHSSGSSIRGKNKLSHLANKKMKTLLTNAANSAVRNDITLNEYYKRKREEGKDHALVINNVRNKLIHIMFGVVKNKKTYDPNHADSYKKTA
ncbi:IS110 family transposase [Dysgonomonas sp. ZJ709]|uniref:IS110 family transposase n=1 Tax=Dysgonomonas sp. ZJ709 TaxID=2709797 RepID=UPI0013ED12BA|nr:IS110 family transposase [Dysgonomonas sp. ZJ709]